jgi:putative addiction module antidote
MHLRKVRRIGNSVGVTLPRELLSALGAKPGDSLILSGSAEKITLGLADPTFVRAMEASEDARRKYRNAFPPPRARRSIAARDRRNDTIPIA